MELISWFIDVILHLDKHLTELVANYSLWVYLILFVIIFCETGLVVTPLARSRRSIRQARSMRRGCGSC